MTGSSARIGFTLLEVVVAALIIAMLAAVTTPTLIGFIDRQRAQTTADKLAAIATGIAAFETAVKTAGGATTNTYPGEVSQLAIPITTVLANDKNSCGTAFTATAVTNWNTNGPFVNFYIPVGGLVTPLGTINNVLVRVPTTATVGVMKIQIPNVVSEDVTTLDQIVDGGDGNAAGIVQWTTPLSGGNTPLLSYLLPVAAKC